MYIERCHVRTTLMQEVPDLGTRIDLSICWGAFAIEVKIREGIPEIA